MNTDQIKQLFQLQKDYSPKVGLSSVDVRLKKLDSIKQYISDPHNQDALTQAIYQDLKRPKVEALAGEVATVLSEIKNLKSNLRRWLKPKKVATPLALTGASSYIHYESKGACLIISPWNYPFQLAVTPLIYAIAAGNTSIIKPSEYSTYTSAYLEKMITALFDEKEVKVIQGGVEVSQSLLACSFDHIYFTGSPAVGKIVMKAAADHLSSLTLELGGKSPCIVDKTADVKKSAERILWGKCFNSGQTCIAPDYVLVHKSKEANLIEQFKTILQKRYNADGKGIINSPDFGRIISERHYLRATLLLRDAQDKGAIVSYGGDNNDDQRFIHPTLLSNTNHEMRIMQEEIFAPILPIISYDKHGEAIHQIRQLPKPLALYIFSKNKTNINNFLRGTSAGGTVINDTLIHYGNHNLPFGGVNNSGIGKSHGTYGVYAFMNERAVMHQHLGASEFLHPPYNKRSISTVNLLSKL
jgi:aldehyde dehydrogenase (NAD+)